ncbi:high-affinity nickel transport protein [Venturia nashicola]|nr:high-affinity nickel transport protein [Venturia nashicola]
MDTNENPKSWTQSLRKKASRAHSRVPYVNKLPFSAVAIIIVMILINIAAWIVAIIALRNHPGLMSTATLAYILGLRHALDADHISAIDLMTRRLLASGQKPVTVGTFFSLGHSTIVIVTSIVVAATAAAVSKNFDNFSHIGGIIGSSVSAAFLLILGIMNIYILVKLIQQLRLLIRTPPGQEIAFKIEGGGVLFSLFKKMFILIDRPWKMYPLGVLFGLGFDTSSEIALLGISSIQSAKGTSLWLILFFPLLFTAGMCMLDTTDGALMMSLYSSATLARDQIAVCYYSVCLTAITVVVALFIGVVQLLILGSNLISEKEGEKGFWKGVDTLGERYDIVGGSICGAFLFFGVLSVLLYRPWRRQVDRRRAHLVEIDESPATAVAGPDIIAGTNSGAIEEVEVITVPVDGKK